MLEKEIEKKREELKNLKDVKSDLIRSHLKNKEIMKSTLTIQEAYRMYLNGDATREELLEYAEKRKNLEYVVKNSEWCLEPDPVIERLERELKELEKQKRSRNRGILIAVSPLAVAALDFLLRFLERHGAEVSSTVYEMLFVVGMFGVLYDMALLISLFTRGKD